LAGWFRHDLKEMAYESLFGNRGCVLLDSSVVKKIWDEHQNGFRDRSTELWTLLMFRLWERKFLTLS